MSQMTDKKIEIRKDKKAVVISDNGYGLELLTMKNGFQWTGCPIDEEILDMLQEAINKFKNS